MNEPDMVIVYVWDLDKYRATYVCDGTRIAHKQFTDLVGENTTRVGAVAQLEAATRRSFALEQVMK